MTNMGSPPGPGRTGVTGTDTASRTQVPPTEDSSSQGIKGETKQAAGTTVDEGKRVASVAGEEVQKVAAETKQQTRALLEDARSQLAEQSRTQRDRLVQTLSTLGDDLDRMSGQVESGLASQLVQQAAQRVQGVSSRLEGREPSDLLGEVRDFARRKPGAFLFGALAAGVVAGRFARGTQKAQTSATPSSGSTSASGSASMPAQRTWEAAETTALPETPSAPTGSFPTEQSGAIR